MIFLFFSAARGNTIGSFFLGFDAEIVITHPKLNGETVDLFFWGVDTHVKPKGVW